MKVEGRSLRVRHTRHVSVVPQCATRGMWAWHHTRVLPSPGRRLLRGSHHASRSGRRRSQGAAHAGSPPLGIGSLGWPAQDAVKPSHPSAPRTTVLAAGAVWWAHRSNSRLSDPRPGGVEPIQPADTRRTDAVLCPTGLRSTSPPRALRMPTDRPRRAPRHSSHQPAGHAACHSACRAACHAAGPPCSRIRLEADAQPASGVRHALPMVPARLALALATRC